MFKKMLSVVAVLALSGIVYGAGNVKTSIDAFAAVNGENATADGRAMFHYKSSDNETSVQLMLDDFTPNTVYDIQYVSGTMGEAAGCDVITTDGQGRAHYKATLSGNWTDAAILIVLSNDCTFTEDEIRAVPN
jgi:hypothetical protein